LFGCVKTKRNLNTNRPQLEGERFMKTVNTLSSMATSAITRARLAASALLSLTTASAALALALHAVTAQAAPVVGTATLAVKDAVRNRSLPTEIWFQAAAGTKTEDFSAVLPIATIAIAPNATPAPDFKKRPLIVISHGNWGTRFSQGWIAMRLVQAGYVVVTPSHPGTMNDDRTTAGAVRLWDRSQDVRVALTAVLSDPRWSALIDPERIGFWGHSFGGWTGVSLAGGRYDMKQLLTACQAQSPQDMYCKGTTSDDLSSISMAGSDADYTDPRFKAFYLTATGPGGSMTKASLQQIRMPMFFDTAQFDEVLSPGINSTFLAATIPGAKEVIRPVGHFAYVPICKPFIGRAVASLICTDPKGVERAEVHQKVATDTLAFFDKQFATARP
jgi:predicted dienelactone hydrolase